ALSPIVSFVFIATHTTLALYHLLHGNDTLIKVPKYQLVSTWEFVDYAVLGVLGGFVSVAFTQLLLRLRAKFLRFPRNTLWFQPLFGGLLVGIMGWFVPQSLGVGYSYVGVALNGASR